MSNYSNRQVACVAPIYWKLVENAVLNRIPEMKFLEMNDCLISEPGRAYEWRVRVSTTTVNGYTGTQGYDFAADYQYQIPTLAYRGLCVGFMLTEEDVDMNQGEGKIFNLLKQKFSEMDDDLDDAWSSDFYGDGSTGTRGALTFHGLASFMSTSATYAGVSQTTYSKWAAQNPSGTGFTTNPVKRLTVMKNTCAVGQPGGGGVNTIKAFLMGQANHETLQDEADGRDRITTDEEGAKLGFDWIKVNGVTCMWSANCGATTVYALNPAKLRLVKGRPEGVGLWKHYEDWTVGAPKQLKCFATSRFNLVCLNPRTQGFMTTS